MHFLNQFRVGPRLMLGFGVVLALLVITLFIGLNRMTMMQANLDDIVHRDYAAITQLNKMRDAVRFQGLALRDVLLQDDFGFVRTEIKRVREAQKAYVSADEALGSLISKEETALLEQIHTQHAQTQEHLTQVMDAALSEDQDTAQSVLRDKLRPAQQALVGKLDEMLALLEAHSLESARTAESAYRTAMGLMGSLGLLALILGGLIAWFITKSITGRLDQSVHVAERIANGDLGAPIASSGRDELARLQTALENMRQSLGGLIGQVADTARDVTVSAGGLNGIVSETTGLADSQAEKVQEISAAMEQMGVSIAEVAENTEAVARSANHTRDVANEGFSKMGESVAATERIVHSVADSSGAIGELSTLIDRISEVTQVIRDIADQTNLLALNAAIEAARAGEQGRGFAVVADEVRKLAERTAASTLSISETVGSVSGKTRQVVDAMARVTQEVNDNAQASHSTRSLLEDIVKAASEVDGLVRHIADATREQRRTSHDTAASMEQISQNSEGTSARMHSLRQSAQGLDQSAQTLQALVGRFRLG
jgi:methyl-accepting chemotaxis protein